MTSHLKGASALCFYDAQNELCQNRAKYSGFFLPQKAGAPQATVPLSSAARSTSTSTALGNCPTSTLTFDFRNASMVDYFVNHIVGPWAADAVTNSVFIDEGDTIAMFGESAKYNRPLATMGMCLTAA